MLGILWPSAIFSLEPQCCDLRQGLRSAVFDTSRFLLVQNAAIAALVSLGSLPAFAALITSGRIGASQPFAALCLNSQRADLPAVRRKCKISEIAPAAFDTKGGMRAFAARHTNGS